MTTRRRSSSRHGFSIVEVLVVLVIFTVGILTMIQIFPGGLGILRTSRSNTVALALARAQMESLKQGDDQLPEAILASTYVWNGTEWVVGFDLNRIPTNVTPPATGLDSAGNLSDAFGTLGPWGLFTGANVARRVIGEGRRIPAPRFVEANNTTLYGGVMTLQFAPVLVRGGFRSEFIVYGADMAKDYVDDITDLPRGGRVQQDFRYYVDGDGTAIALPQGPVRNDVANFERQYRISASARYNSGGNIVRRVRVIVVPVPEAAGNRFYIPFDLATLMAEPGLTFIGAELDTIRVQRVFDPAATFLTEADVQANPSLRDDAAYQMVLLSDSLGAILFNPLASTYVERRGGGRFPMTARVDYDVLDWRNIRDDFRVPNQIPFQRKLILESLKVQGEQDNDGLVFNGLEFQVAGNTGGFERRDFVVFDRETGGVYTPDSYNIDKSSGILTFRDVDNDLSNGLSARIVFSGENTPTVIPDVRGRSVRAIYQAKGDFAIQVIKPTSNYQAVSSSSLGFGQCYVGGTDIAATGLPRRLYFPLADVGKKVIVGEAWYQDGSGNPQVMEEQDFIIQADPALPLGFIDLTEKRPAATSFDFSRGYAVRNVRGASVTARVFWNTARFNLTTNPAENMNRLGTWLGSLRRTSTESFLVRGNTE